MSRFRYSICVDFDNLPLFEYEGLKEGGSLFNNSFNIKNDKFWKLIFEFNPKLPKAIIQSLLIPAKSVVIGSSFSNNKYLFRMKGKAKVRITKQMQYFAPILLSILL